MTREEIKEEVLNNDTEQKFIIQNAHFISLVTQLIRKGILTREDIDEISDLSEEKINSLNEKIVDMFIEENLKKGNYD